QAAQDQLYRWSKLRSSYLAEANNDAARIYTGNSWYGGGWYWDPWFGTYTFIPANGIFYSPFGWGFYSPALIYTGPAFFGPRFHTFVGFPPRFDPRVFPLVVTGPRPAPFRPVAPRIAGPRPVPRVGGVQGFRGTGGFHGAGGVHGAATGFH